MVHELAYHDKASFITLTYDDDHLPEGGTLCKRHVQLYLKLLRKEMYPRKLRYYIAGEYGELRKRPHYHGIFFGLGLEEEDQLLTITFWPHADWSNDHIRRHAFGIVNDDTIRYTAQYIDQKLYGDEAMEVYDATGRERPFNLQSKGIGRQWCDEHVELISTGRITFRGRPSTIPRYYVKRLDLDMSAIGEQADVDEIERLTGLSYSDDEYYRVAKPSEYKVLDEQRHAQRVQRHKNAKGRGALKRRDCD